MSLGSAAAPIKRFYKDVSVVPGPEGFQVQLDGRPVRTPGRHMLSVPGAALAQEIAAEWAGQGETIDPLSMPITRLVNSAHDGVAAAMEAVGAEIVRYAGSDLVCYRTDGPAKLVALQAELWDPVLDWAKARFDARFLLAEGVMHVTQPQASLDAVAARLPGDPLRLAALNLMTTLSGSALIALAVLEGQLSAEAGWRAAHIDEEVQEELWGADREAELRRQARWRDFRAAARLAELLGAP
ncbi:chaperone required for assembly of F1-ATPase [Ancylobacter sp. 3268]|uniref:ATP12 family chaperone protein n=1 Tax=Ancylobacter sp. 3268 TaxID=2817752 RepID=UPI0028679565|nr:ATP12 family protein [Ancylobacter sp. 3268]MDR6954423.1 chaperone required for assembly of F1-ATPase [Ancylobacter sp. 3268]